MKLPNLIFWICGGFFAVRFQLIMLWIQCFWRRVCSFLRLNAKKVASKHPIISVFDQAQQKSIQNLSYMSHHPANYFGLLLLIKQSEMYICFCYASLFLLKTPKKEHYSKNVVKSCFCLSWQWILLAGGTIWVTKYLWK